MKKNKLLSNSGFSLMELMVATGILIIIMAGLFYTYIACFELNEFSRNLMLVNNALQAQLETIRGDLRTSTDPNNFDVRAVAMNGAVVPLNTFGVGQPAGFIYIFTEGFSSPLDAARSQYIRMVACWRQKSGRVIGEDSNLDGIFNPLTEDANGNGMIDSPAELITLITYHE